MKVAIIGTREFQTIMEVLSNVQNTLRSGWLKEVSKLRYIAGMIIHFSKSHGWE